MAYYRTCPLCGAALDPGEKCDCLESRTIEAFLRAAPEIKAQARALVERFQNEKTAPDAANIQSGYGK